MSEIKRGKFIVVEGLDGSGKTTQVQLLKEKMEELHGETMLFKNVSDGRIGKTIRSVLDPQNQLYVNNLQMACLFIAELYVVANKINAYLDHGVNVICDRWTYSTLAYAGYTDADRELIRGMYSKLLAPDIVIYLDVDPKTAIGRINARGEAKELYEDVGKLAAIGNRYTVNVFLDTSNLIVIDKDMNAGKKPQDICDYTMYRVQEIFKA